MIDCHAHYYPPLFDPLSDNVPADLTVIAVSENLDEAQQILDLSQRLKFVKPCAGLHPEFISLHQDQLHQQLLDFEKFMVLHNNSLVGIGECGLDYSMKVIPKDLSDDDKLNIKQTQQMCFSRHIEYGKSYNLPLVSLKMLINKNVHSRNAGHYAIKALYESQAKAVLHAFDGKVSYALQGVSHDLLFSVPPCVIRSDQFRKLVKEIPLTHLLLESDAPALGPIINQDNHPRNVLISAQEIAKIKGISFDQVVQITTENAKKLFNLY